MDSSRLGHIVQEINVLVAGLRNGFISCVKEFGNLVTHSLVGMLNLFLIEKRFFFTFTHTHYSHCSFFFYTLCFFFFF